MPKGDLVGRKVLLVIAALALTAGLVGTVEAGEPGSPTRLTPTFEQGGGIVRTVVSPNGSRVAYVLDPDGSGNEGLWSVSIDGGSSTRLSPVLDVPASVRWATFTPNSAQVLYVGSGASGGGLYSVPARGGEAIRLWPQVGANSSATVDTLRVSSDSSRVAYKVSSGDPDEIGLWSAPLSGGPPVRLSPEFRWFDLTGLVSCRYHC